MFLKVTTLIQVTVMFLIHFLKILHLIITKTTLTIKKVKEGIKNTSFLGISKVENKLIAPHSRGR